MRQEWVFSGHENHFGQKGTVSGRKTDTLSFVSLSIFGMFFKFKNYAK